MVTRLCRFDSRAALCRSGRLDSFFGILAIRGRHAFTMRYNHVMTTTQTTEVAQWTYAYDGSGIELRTACEVIDSEGDFVTIKITNPIDEVRSALKFYPRHFPQHHFEQVDEVTFLFTVGARDVTTAAWPKVASFGWLD